MATEVDDELEKYAKPPTDDELEQYAKPTADEGEKGIPEERQLPGATERLKATAKRFKAPFREEIEHPPQPENLGFTLENLTNLPGRFAKGLGNVYEFGKNVVSDVAGVRGPSDLGKITEKYVNKPQEEQADIASQYEEKARKEPFLSREGLLDAITGTGHRIASVTPFVGPWVAGHAENLGKTGDVPGEAAEVGGEMAGGKLAERIGAHPVESARAVGALADKIARGTPITEAGKRQAAFQQAMGIKKPSMSETEYATRVQAAMPELQRIAKENPNIKTPRDEVQAINNRVAQIEAPIAHHLEQVPDAQQMVPATAWVPGVDQAMDAAFQSKGRGHFSPEEMDKAKQAVWKFIGDQDKPAAVMEGNRRRLNDLASDYWKSKTAGKQSIDVGDATAVAQRAASDAMRDHLYGDGTNPGALEQAGITARDTSGNPVDIRSVRKTVGNLLEIRNHFEDAITKAEDTGNWKAWAKLHVGPSVAAGGLGLAAGTLAGHPLLGILAGEGIKAWGDYLRSKNPNVLTAKMNRNLRGLPESVTADVQTQMPAPPVPPVPFQHTVGAATPPPPVPQAFRMQPTGTVGSLGQLGTRGRGGVSIAGLLPERIGQEATEPPPVPTQFRTEPVGEARNQNLLGARGLGGVVAPRMAGLLPERIGQPEPEPGAPPPAVAGKFALEPTGTVEDATRLGQRGLGGILAPRVKGLLGEGLPEKIGGEGREGTLEPLKKKEPESTLGKISEEQIPYTRPLPIPASKIDVPHGTTQPSVLHHELGHAIVAGLNDLETNGIVTHRYPLMSSAHAVAALLMPREQFYEPDGAFKKEFLLDGGKRLTDMFAAGAAANELIDGIHRDKNVGLWGDRKAAAKIFNALDIPLDDHHDLFNAAVDRAKEKLSGPGITDLIRSEAKFREDNLPVEFHFSPRRVERIMQEVRRLQNEPAKSDLGHETAAFSGRGEGGGETVAGREGAGTQEPRKAPAPWEIKPFKSPKRTYEFILDRDNDHPVTLEALNRNKAFEEARKKYPNAMSYRMTAERMPEVGPPFEMAPFAQRAEGFEHISPKLMEHLEPDELDFIKGNKRAQQNIQESFNNIKPTFAQTKAAIQAGSALAGWWRRFIDTFDALGEPSEGAKIEKLGPEHAEALKAWHSAVSGNKSVADANRTAWGTYADWLDAGRPKDRKTINEIVAANGKPKGNAAISDTLGKNGKVLNQGLDTTKLYNLINSPQMRDISPEPFHGKIFDPENPSPVAGVSPGARKIPSMAATVAGKGNLNRLVLDAHMLDFYGENGWTDNKYIAHSAHLRAVAKEMGLTGGEAQEQIWGTVLGLKKLMREGRSPAQAAGGLSGETINSIGKDYADIIKDDPELNSIFEQLKKHGIDPGGERAQQRLREITSGKPAIQEAGTNKNLLTHVAKRIQGQLAKPEPIKITKPVTGGAPASTQAGKRLAAK